jgi:hypothetical protein
VPQPPPHSGGQGVADRARRPPFFDTFGAAPRRERGHPCPHKRACSTLQCEAPQLKVELWRFFLFALTRSRRAGMPALPACGCVGVCAAVGVLRRGRGEGREGLEVPRALRCCCCREVSRGVAVARRPCRWRRTPSRSPLARVFYSAFFIASLTICATNPFLA